MQRNQGIGRPRVLLTLAAIGVGFGVGCRPEGQNEAKAPEQTIDPAHGDMLRTTLRDQEEIFGRALWRHPGPDDRIVHAERREWAAAAPREAMEGSGPSVSPGSVQAWQWYLAVQPGTELQAWLRTNPFGLRADTGSGNAASVAAADTPAWFRRDWTGAQIQSQAGGGLVFIYFASENLLYATDAGSGFAEAVVGGENP